jgi:hypothetical protein
MAATGVPGTNQQLSSYDGYVLPFVATKKQGDIPERMTLVEMEVKRIGAQGPAKGW